MVLCPHTALIGGPGDSSGVGAAWAFIAPTAVSTPPGLGFGSQTTSQPGLVLWLPVVDSGQAPLQFSGPASISGPDAADFVIPAGDDLCAAQTLPPQGTCWIGVQFTPRATGTGSPGLSLGPSNASGSPTIALTGTGVAPDSGPAGRQGPSGPQATAGTAGAQGATDPQGQPGQVELVTCRRVTATLVKKVHGHRHRVRVNRQKCIGSLVSGPVKFTTNGASAHATLKRAHVVYATGSGWIVPGRTRLMAFTLRRRTPPGRYTLVLRARRGRRTITSREHVTIALDAGDRFPGGFVL